jgi:hypothetical protein
MEKNGRILFDRPKPTVGCSASGIIIVIIIIIIIIFVLNLKAVRVIQRVLILIISCRSFIGLSKLAFILHVSRVTGGLLGELLKYVFFFCNSEINIFSYEMFVISDIPVSNVTVCRLKDHKSIHNAESEVSHHTIHFSRC